MQWQQTGEFFPASKGSYLLITQLAAKRTTPIGKFGVFTFPAGWYLYCGSAYGSGGLRARLTRHTGSEKKPHWHIDYLLPLVTVTEVRWVFERVECAAAEALCAAGGNRTVPRFGAGDCRCTGHLIWFPAHTFAPLASGLYPLQ